MQVFPHHLSSTIIMNNAVLFVHTWDWTRTHCNRSCCWKCLFSLRDEHSAAASLNAWKSFPATPAAPSCAAKSMLIERTSHKNASNIQTYMPRSRWSAGIHTQSSRIGKRAGRITLLWSLARDNWNPWAWNAHKFATRVSKDRVSHVGCCAGAYCMSFFVTKQKRHGCLPLDLDKPKQEQMNS